MVTKVPSFVQSLHTIQGVSGGALTAAALVGCPDKIYTEVKTSILMCRFILLMYRKKSPQGRTNTLQNFVCFEADGYVWFPRFWFHKFELFQYAIQGQTLASLEQLLPSNIHEIASENGLEVLCAGNTVKFISKCASK